jgi:protein-S-isoprenylcysteine O-methyltransferase Ste14
LTYAGIRRQVAEEERYLRHAYGADYSAYAAQVGRFTPWLGRLA